MNSRSGVSASRAINFARGSERACYICMSRWPWRYSKDSIYS